jgi:hypothetical protein
MNCSSVGSRSVAAAIGAVGFEYLEAAVMAFPLHSPGGKP